MRSILLSLSSLISASFLVDMWNAAITTMRCFASSIKTRSGSDALTLADGFEHTEQSVCRDDTFQPKSCAFQ